MRTKAPTVIRTKEFKAKMIRISLVRDKELKIPSEINSKWRRTSKVANKQMMKPCKMRLSLRTLISSAIKHRALVKVKIQSLRCLRRTNSRRSLKGKRPTRILSYLKSLQQRAATIQGKRGGRKLSRTHLITSRSSTR